MGAGSEGPSGSAGSGHAALDPETFGAGARAAAVVAGAAPGSGRSGPTAGDSVPWLDPHACACRTATPSIPTASKGASQQGREPATHSIERS